MEQFLRPLFSFSEFKKIFQVELTSKSVVENYYPLALFGHVCGFLPIRNILPRYQGIHYLEFTWLSYPVLYTLIINILLYFFTLEPSFFLYKDGYHFRFSTDDFALRVFFVFYSLSKVTIHFLTIYRVQAILRCLKSIESYDAHFHHQNHTLILSRYVIIFFFGTLMSAGLTTWVTFANTWNNVSENFENSNLGLTERYWSLTVLPEPLLLTLVSFLTHLVAESAIFFAQSTIAYIVNCVCDRLKLIEMEIMRHSTAIPPHLAIQLEVDAGVNGNTIPPSIDVDAQTQNQINTIWIESTPKFAATTTPKFTSASTPKFTSASTSSARENRSNEIRNCIRTHTTKFLWLLDIIQMLNTVASEIIVVFTTSSTVITVSLCYLIVMFMSEWENHGFGRSIFVVNNTLRDTNFAQVATILLIVTLTIGRLINFANTGEKLQNSIAKLGNSIKKFDPSDDADVFRAYSYMWLITSDVNAYLNGGGFFRLNRAGLTSIVAPVITFIVILAQFRTSDMQSHNGLNSTMQSST